MATRKRPNLAMRIISLLPPHGVFVEPFAGTSPLSAVKLPARRTIVIDCNPVVVAELEGLTSDWAEVTLGDGVVFMETLGDDGGAVECEKAEPLTARILVVCRPPAIRVRTHLAKAKPFWSEAEHRRFLRVANRLKCFTAVVARSSPLYETELAGWTRVRLTRICSESRGYVSWLNFARPTVLHDYRFIGGNKSGCRAVRRQQERLINKLHQMRPVHRNAMLQRIAAEFARSFANPRMKIPRELDAALDRATAQSIIGWPDYILAKELQVKSAKELAGKRRCKRCEYCHGEFLARLNQRFCSRLCAQRAQGKRLACAQFDALNRELTNRMKGRDDGRDADS